MPFPRCKGNLYDWGSRVPLVVRWGKHLPAGKQVDDFVSLTDLAPTFLEAAEIEIPESMTGQSLLPVINNDGVWTIWTGGICRVMRKRRET